MAYLQTVDSELERLEKLITRFLEFARLDLRIMTPQLEVLNVLEECRQVLNLLQPLAEAKGISLETDFAPREDALKKPDSAHRSAAGVAETCWRMPSSLVPAAVRSGRKSGRRSRAIRSAVYDQGPGIRAPMTWPISSNFFHPGAAGGGDTQGFGLGLAACQADHRRTHGRPHLGGHGPRPRLHLLCTFPLQGPQAPEVASPR